VAHGAVFVYREWPTRPAPAIKVQCGEIDWPLGKNCRCGVGLNLKIVAFEKGGIDNFYE
jgi:hypothetical protein